MAKLKIFFIISVVFLFANQEAIAGNFTDNGNGTVTDNNTKLMWQQEDDNVTRVWESALNYCEGLFLAGYNDWRLPNIRELKSIVNYTKSGPAINAVYFPNTNSSYYWSATTDAGDSNYAWVVYFSNGYVSSPNKTSTYYVRCVRGGQ